MRALLLVASCVVLVACSKPSPPTLTPKQATVRSISPLGVTLEVALDATNSNAVDLSAGNITAHVVLDKQVEVGTATVEQVINLPANQTTEIKVDLSVPWSDVVPLAGLAMSEKAWFPYAVDGTMSLGGELLHVNVPFHLEGKVSREQLAIATVNSLPSIPGITGPMGSATGGTPPGSRPGSALPGAPRHAPRVFH